MSKDGKTFRRLPRNATGDFTVQDGVEVIAKGAFAGCDGLTSIMLPNSVKVINDEAFLGCANLKTMLLPEGLETIGEKAFFACTELEEIILPSTLKSIGVMAFHSCCELKSIAIPQGIDTIPGGCFESCLSLSDVILPDSVEVIGPHAFSQCKLKSFTFGPNIKTIGDSSFGQCKCESIIIGASVKNIGPCAFFGNNLNKIEVDTGNRYFTDAKCNVIMEQTSGKIIQGTSNSTIPEGARIIGLGAFNSQPAPKELVIPSSVETIESGAFIGCGESVIRLENGVKAIRECAFISFGREEKMTIYIPASTEKIDAQFSSVDFRLDPNNPYYWYDAEGDNIISNEGALIWGRLLQGIPTTGVTQVRFYPLGDFGYSKLIIPQNVKSINDILSNSGIEKVLLEKGTMLDVSATWKTPCEIDYIIPQKKGPGKICKNTKYTIPAGVSRAAIDDFLGKDSFFL